MRAHSFRKMHGLGNDFVVIDARSRPVAMDPIQARRIADRRLGVGADEVIVIGPSTAAEAFMGIWNPDGQEVAACGNATRCVAALLMAETGRAEVALETRAGVLLCHDAGAGLVTVDMGVPKLDWRDIPLSQPLDTARAEIGFAGLPPASCVNMGNPHAVFFVDRLDAFDLGHFGPVLERHSLFPDRVNVTLAQRNGPGQFTLRVWERGAGLTLACGTAACATLVAAVRAGLSERAAQMILPGGSLTISWRASDGHVLMTGPWAQSFTGELGPGLLDGFVP
jgi:diaminopimelate epimerase